MARHQRFGDGGIGRVVSACPHTRSPDPTSPVCLRRRLCLLDPAVIGWTAARSIHFVAKAPLFDVPVLGSLMRALGMIPAFRGRDDFAQVGRNTGSLDSAAQWLLRGEAVGIFPEGISHDLTRVEQVRSGAARMAVQAARRGARVIVVPLGLNYERKEQFSSSVWVRVGEPIDLIA